VGHVGGIDFCNDRGQWAGNGNMRIGQRGALLWFWLASLLVHYREAQHGRGPTGSLELHERLGSWRSPNYSRKTLAGEILEPWKVSLYLIEK